MKYETDNLTTTIASVRRRRTLLIALRGIAIALAVTTGMLLLTGLAAYRYRFSTGALIGLRLVALLAIVATVFFFLVRPLRRKVSDAMIARLVEERQEGLEDRLVSAVEYSDLTQQSRSSVSIIDRLMADASICGLGQAAPNVIRCVQRYFPDEV